MKRKAKPPTRRPTTLSVADSLQLAMNLHRSNRPAEARTLYERILKATADLPDAWHFLGMLHFQEGRKAEGIVAVRRSIELCPGYADAHANLANMLIAGEHYEEAEAHLHRALALMPDAVPPLIGLALIFRKSGRPAEAEALVRPAVERNPNDGALRYAIANALLELERTEEAIEHYMHAIVLRPDIEGAQRLLAYAQCRLGRLDEAAAHYRKRLEASPDDVEARHMLAACGGAAVPERANDAYVQSHFDDFAKTFDAKLARLGYRAPELIEKTAALCLTAPAANLTVLDAGCGTGLLGPLLKPWCAELVGVDLSPGMLAYAVERKVYDSLIEAELGAFLALHPGRYDVVASADTLCYFGALEEVMRQAHEALRPGGWLFFTVENGGEQADGYKLQFHGRYAHRRDYVEHALEHAGFTDIQVGTEHLRMEAGRPVAGLVLAAKRGNTTWH